MATWQLGALNQRHTSQTFFTRGCSHWAPSDRGGSLCLGTKGHGGGRDWTTAVATWLTAAWCSEHLRLGDARVHSQGEITPRHPQSVTAMGRPWGEDQWLVNLGCPHWEAWEHHSSHHDHIFIAENQNLGFIFFYDLNTKMKRQYSRSVLRWPLEKPFQLNGLSRYYKVNEREVDAALATLI